MYRELLCLIGAGLVIVASQGVGAQELGRGNVLVEYWWDGGINSNIGSLKAHPDFPTRPGASEWWQGSERPDLAYTNYFGARVRGYLTPPETGNYTFWIWSNDDGELYASSDDNPANKSKVPIAHVTGLTPPNRWDEYPTQKSAPLHLVGGKRYYFEALYADGIGDGFVRVGWGGPGIGPGPVPIDRKYLSAFIRDPEPLFLARDPSPANGALNTVPLLQWTAGEAAMLHDVYLGTGVDLTDADLVMRHQRDTKYYHVMGLTPGTTYYWRVDEVQANGTVIPGNVWSFSCPPVTAYEPSPTDGSIAYVGGDRKVLLAWTAGFGAIMHHVYFGDRFADVANATGDTDVGSQAETVFMVGPLEPETTYYWRIDEIDATGASIVGDVWSFKTVAPVEPTVFFYEGFEDYNDGLVPWTGTKFVTVGHPFGDGLSLMETRPEYVCSGSRSMPLYCHDLDSSYDSRADYSFGEPQNWTLKGVDSNDITVSLSIRGQPGRDPAQLFIAITDAHGKVAHPPDAEVTLTAAWRRWTIPLSVFAGVDLRAVMRISIGVRVSSRYAHTDHMDLSAAAASDDVFVAVCDDVSVGTGTAGTGNVRMRGYVRDVRTGVSISGATVTLEPGPYEDTTDNDCEYWVEPSEGKCYTVTVTADHFQRYDMPGAIKLCCDTRMDFALIPDHLPAMDCPVYRFLSIAASNENSYFCTVADQERDKLLKYAKDWEYKGIAFCAAAHGGHPVYRFWHNWKSTHFYTISETEKNKLISECSVAWQHEGQVFNAYPAGAGDPKPANTCDVYRFWCATPGRHFYTVDLGEQKPNCSESWTPEGVVWYAHDRPR